jgi:integrase
MELAANTLSNYSKALRTFLSWLIKYEGGAADLCEAVPRYRQPPARLITATPEERETLLAHSTEAMRFFLLLCADLGLRHTTAARLTLAAYRPELDAISFVTKGGVHQTLPLTDELRPYFARLRKAKADTTKPIINVLRAHLPRHEQPADQPNMREQWRKLKAKCGIRKELRVHDLRRTAAEAIYTVTHDVRAVQAFLGHKSPVTTARYLADRTTLDDLRQAVTKTELLHMQPKGANQ